MTLRVEEEKRARAAGFVFWLPPAGRSVEVGLEHRPFRLPAIPLPLHVAAAAAGEPGDMAIGEGVYDFLRHFLDCRHNGAYAQLLLGAYPYYVADLGAQVGKDCILEGRSL